MIPNRKETIVANNPGPCPECPKYSSCQEMCERVESWVNQDSVGRNSKMLLENRNRTGSEERLDDYVDYMDFMNKDVIRPDSTLSADSWNNVCSLRLSDKIIRMIYSYYMLGKRIRDIAIDEKTSSQAIDQRHNQAKISLAKRLKQRDHWLEIRGKLKYKSVRDYDICYLSFGAGYPRKTIAKLMRLHVSTVINIIKKKNRELRSLS